MMDESVRRAMAKWPNVPALYGWLRLDGHGRWLLKGEPVSHPGLNAFIGRNYAADERGRWYFQNGPQRGYVSLEYTPWILHVDSAGALRIHTGRVAERVEVAVLDDEGNLLLATEHGPGLVDTDALGTLCDWFVDAAGNPLAPDALEACFTALQAGRTVDCRLHYRGHDAPLTYIRRAEIPGYFGFVPDPATPDADGPARQD